LKLNYVKDFNIQEQNFTPLFHLENILKKILKENKKREKITLE
jgi:hypothetical protein